MCLNFEIEYLFMSFNIYIKDNSVMEEQYIITF